MSKKAYIVLIGDLVQSRSVPNRRAVQKKFTAACAKLNSEAEALGLVSPLTITLGDEFQAVFKNSAKLWDCIFRLEAAMAPIEIRFAVGVGEITTAVRRDTAIGMDGPAFYVARSAIEYLKSSGDRYRVSGIGQDEDFLNAVLEMLSRNRKKWRPSRMLTLASLLQGKGIGEICKLTKTTEQAVYRNIRDGALDTVRRLIEGISARIDRTIG